VGYSYDGLGHRVGALGEAGERRFVTVPAMGDGLAAPHLVIDDGSAVVAGYGYAGKLPLLRFGTDGEPVYYLTPGGREGECPESGRFDGRKHGAFRLRRVRERRGIDG